MNSFIIISNDSVTVLSFYELALTLLLIYIYIYLLSNSFNIKICNYLSFSCKISLNDRFFPLKSFFNVVVYIYLSLFHLYFLIQLYI